MVWKPSHTSGNPTLFLPRGSGAVTSHGTLLPASHHSAAGGQQHGGHSGGRGACTRRGQGCTLARLRHNHGSRPADHCPESVSARYRGSRGGWRHGRGRFVGGSTRSGCGRCQNRGRRGGGRRGGIRRGNHRGRRHQRGYRGGGRCARGRSRRGRRRGHGEGVGVVEDGDGTGTGVAITVDAAGYTPVTVIVTDGGFS